MSRSITQLTRWCPSTMIPSATILSPVSTSMTSPTTTSVFGIICGCRRGRTCLIEWPVAMHDQNATCFALCPPCRMCFYGNWPAVPAWRRARAHSPAHQNLAAAHNLDFYHVLDRVQLAELEILLVVVAGACAARPCTRARARMCPTETFACAACAGASALHTAAGW